MEDSGDPISQVFHEACKLKDQARISRDHLELYDKAAECFHTAGELSEQLSRSTDIDHATLSQAQLFALYYFYEEQECRSTASYERHDIAESRASHHKGVSLLNRAIEMVDEVVPAVSDQCAIHLKRNQRVWRYYLHVNDIEFLAIQAREAWDRGDLIRALDFYRSLLTRSPHLIQDADYPQLDPVYKRIAIGNFFGMQVNASQALAQMFLDRASKEVLPPDLGLMFLQELFTAYRVGLVAFRSNPEWDHYRTDSGQVLSIIKEFLLLNRDKWMSIFIVFEHDPEFLAIMKEVDLKRYKEAEEERQLGASKAVKFWQYGGFWLLAFSIVFAAVFLLVTHSAAWWQLVFSIIGLEVLILILGAITLRSVGDLSERGFLALIGTAMQQKFKVFTLIKGLFSNSPKRTESSGEGEKE